MMMLVPGVWRGPGRAELGGGGPRERERAPRQQRHLGRTQRLVVRRAPKLRSRRSVRRAAATTAADLAVVVVLPLPAGPVSRIMPERMLS